MRTLQTLTVLVICFMSATAWTSRTSKQSSPLKTAPVAPFLSTGSALVVVLIPLVAAGGAAYAADVAAGQKIFEANCAACHEGGQNRIVKEKTLQQDAIAQNVGLDAGKIKAFVQNSGIHQGALMFGGKLSDDDFTNVAAFVLDQAVENKW